MLQRNMLQNDRARALLDSSMPSVRAEENGFGGLVNPALGFLRRRYALIVLTAALAFTASVIYLRITPPTYTAQVNVLLGNPKSQFIEQQSVLAETPIGSPQLESQIQVLKSKAIAASVINQLKLADDPDFKEPGPSWRSVIRKWFGSTPSGRQVDPTDRLVAAFDERLTAARVGFSMVVEIGFSASSAERSAEIANAVANTYIADQLNTKLEANRTGPSEGIGEPGPDSRTCSQRA